MTPETITLAEELPAIAKRPRRKPGVIYMTTPGVMATNTLTRLG